jgi:hypothetical protein
MIADQGVNCLGSQAGWITLAPQREIDDLLCSVASKTANRISVSSGRNA